MKIKLLLSIALIVQAGLSCAQQKDSLQTPETSVGAAPIPIEVFAGDKGFTFQLIVSKQLSPRSRFGFFNVTNLMGDYKEVNQSAEFFSQSLLTAEILRGFSLTAGLSAIGSATSQFISVRPTAGLQYLFANRDFVVVVLPRFDLTQTYNFETFAVFEYKPRLSKNWGIYTRAQGLYNYNPKFGNHEVSSIYLRLGLSYKNVQFGLGTNHDFYGPQPFTVNNFGGFIKTDIF